MIFFGGDIIKKIIIILILTVTILGLSNVYKNEVFLNNKNQWEYYDFREAIQGTYKGIKYGATMDTVLNFITPITKTATYMVFNDTFLKRKVEATMYFYNNQLYKIKNFYNPGWSPESALNEFDKLRNELTDIYGNPIKDYVYYDNSFLIGRREYAYKNGQARLETKWENDYVTITIELYRKNNLNNMQITYVSKEIKTE